MPNAVSPPSVRVLRPRLATAFDTHQRAGASGWSDRTLGRWHSAADLYLEGFPIGSYTALLERQLAGRAVVRKPLLVPRSVLPVDKGALGGVPVPARSCDYVERVGCTASDAAAGTGRPARTGRPCCIATAGRPGTQRLAELDGAVPREHAPVVPSAVASVAVRARGLLGLRYTSLDGPAMPSCCVSRGLERGLRPRVDAAMYRGLEAARDRGCLSQAP